MTSRVGASALAGIAVGTWLVAPTAGAGAGAPAEPAPQPRFRSGVEVVEVAVVARDSSGRPVTDLTRADLTLLEQGVVQEIVGFERVSLPAAPAPPRREVVPADVSSNEALAQSRVFVLVLDALHVAPDRNRPVRDYARQFVERVVGPNDLTAVFSPGAVATATADFTSDKARVLAAIDSFTGTKLPSATVERDKEQRQFYSGVPVHGGKDPDDAPRKPERPG